MTGATTNYPIVVARLGSLVGKLRTAVERGLRRGLEQVRTSAQVHYLSGPRPRILDVVSTRLRNSISIKVESDSSAITGRAGTNVAYGAYHEFGFHGVQHVSSHTRVTGITTRRGKVSGPDLRMMRGPIRDKAGNLVGFKRSLRAAVGSMKTGFASFAFVKAHVRHVDYDGRPFMRPAIDRERDQVVRQITSGLSAAAAQT